MISVIFTPKYVPFINSVSSKGPKIITLNTKRDQNKSYQKRIQRDKVVLCFFKYHYQAVHELLALFKSCSYIYIINYLSVSIMKRPLRMLFEVEDFGLKAA